MSVDTATFKAKFPEFENAPDAVVDAFITDAVVLCPDDVWGDFTDMGVELHTARSLALSPMGRGMELGSDGMTVYDGRLAELRRIVSIGGRVI